MEDAAVWGVGSGLGLILLLGKMAWDKFLSPEGKANDALIGQLGDPNCHLAHPAGRRLQCRRAAIRA